MSNRASKMWRKFGVGGAELCSIFAAENGLLSIPRANEVAEKHRFPHHNHGAGHLELRLPAA